jgi:hypothetical protein
MEHGDRLHWLAEVAKINQRLNEQAGQFSLE